jgi:hypothetical protein
MTADFAILIHSFIFTYRNCDSNKYNEDCFRNFRLGFSHVADIENADIEMMRVKFSSDVTVSQEIQVHVDLAQTNLASR